MKTDKSKSILLLHLAVVLFGFTAILGDLIQMSALMIVWWRVLITCASLLLFIQFGRKLKELSRQQVIIFLGVGVIIAAHWLTFYGAVKLANASVTLICMATTTFFTSFIEPWFFKTKLNTVDILLGIAIVPCMVLVVNGIPEAHYVGAGVGLFSAFAAALFAVINKKYVDQVNVLSMTFIEMLSVFITLSLIVPFMIKSSEEFVFVPPALSDWFYIGILALVCTTFAWVISLYALRNVSVFEANLIICLEPVYGIVLAALILSEHDSLSILFYIGSALILSIVLLYPYLNKKYINYQPKVTDDGHHSTK